MNRFLTNLGIFLLMIGAILIGLIFLSDLAVNDRKSDFLKFNDNIKYIFSGDSHVECAVNDDLVHGSINIAQSGEAYLYSYAKIKALLENNDQIKTVFLGYSFGDLQKDKETMWLFGDISVTEFIKNYNYLLTWEERSVLIKNNPKAYFKGLTKSVFTNLMIFARNLISHHDISFLGNFGGYLFLDRNKLQEDIEMADNYRIEPLNKSMIQEKYLNKISLLCHQKSVHLILLNTPKYPVYKEAINENIRLNWIAVRETLKKDSLLDFSSYLLPDSCYGDMTHLNYKGAEVFSRYLNDLITKNFL